jgi:hypothetical protein
MPSPKRSRGRPRGEGKKDLPYLTQVADLMARDASLRPTTTMKRVMLQKKDWGASDETLLRRWQGKWKQRGAAMLTQARERMRPPASVARTSIDLCLLVEGYQRQLAKAAKPMEDLVLRLKAEGSPWIKMSADVQKLLRYEAKLRELENLPALKALRDWQNTRQAQDMEKLFLSKTWSLS